MVVTLRDRNQRLFGKADGESESRKMDADMGPCWRKDGSLVGKRRISDGEIKVDFQTGRETKTETADRESDRGPKDPNEKAMMGPCGGKKADQ